MQYFDNLRNSVSQTSTALTIAVSQASQKTAYWVINNLWGVEYPVAPALPAPEAARQPTMCDDLPFMQAQCQDFIQTSTYATIKEWWSQNCPFWCPQVPEVVVVNDLFEQQPLSICDGLDQHFQGLEKMCVSALDARDAFGQFNMDLAQKMAIEPETLALAEVGAMAVAATGTLYVTYRGLKALYNRARHQSKDAELGLPAQELQNQEPVVVELAKEPVVAPQLEQAHDQSEQKLEGTELEQAVQRHWNNVRRKHAGQWNMVELAETIGTESTQPRQLATNALERAKNAVEGNNRSQGIKVQ